MVVVSPGVVDELAKARGDGGGSPRKVGAEQGVVFRDAVDILGEGRDGGEFVSVDERVGGGCILGGVGGAQVHHDGVVELEGHVKLFGDVVLQDGIFHGEIEGVLAGYPGLGEGFGGGRGRRERGHPGSFVLVGKARAKRVGGDPVHHFLQEGAVSMAGIRHEEGHEGLWCR